MTIKILIVGPPHGGKGTLCKGITDRYDIVHVSTGDILRNEVRAKSKLGLEIEGMMSEGRLVPDKLVLELLIQEIKKYTAQNKGLLIDGFPRTKAQAEALKQAGLKFNAMVVLECDDSTLRERCLGRRVDPDTGHSYHIKFQPPPDDIASRLVTRPDDTLEGLVRRVATYNSEKAALIEVFGDIKVVINSSQNPQVVLHDFKREVSKISGCAVLLDRITRRSKL
eukprot:Tbor_TRINITY_DN5301_c0_g6::TRINITY_DN5301_c0_g6_i1::g.4800::m.4800/K00939/adk, AK; adenylate kinase